MTLITRDDIIILIDKWRKKHFSQILYTNCEEYSGSIGDELFCDKVKGEIRKTITLEELASQYPNIFVELI